MCIRDSFGGDWLRQQAEKLGMKVWIKSASEQIHNIAVQGPLARELLKKMIWTPGTQPKLEEDVYKRQARRPAARASAWAGGAHGAACWRCTGRDAA